MIQYIKNLIGNSWKHFVVWCTAYHFAGWIHRLILDSDPSAIMSLWIWLVVVAIMVGAMIELNQRRIILKKGGVWNWKHALWDFGMGLAGAVLGLLPFWRG